MNPITRGMNNFCEGLVNSSHANYISSTQSSYIPPPPQVISYTPSTHTPIEIPKSYTEKSISFAMSLPSLNPGYQATSYQPSYQPSYLPSYLPK